MSITPPRITGYVHTELDDGLVGSGIGGVRSENSKTMSLDITSEFMSIYIICLRYDKYMILAFHLNEKSKARKDEIYCNACSDDHLSMASGFNIPRIIVSKA